MKRRLLDFLAGVGAITVTLLLMGAASTTVSYFKSIAVRDNSNVAVTTITNTSGSIGIGRSLIPYWAPDANDVLFGVHDISKGEASGGYLGMSGVDNAASVTNWFDAYLQGSTPSGTARVVLNGNTATNVDNVTLTSESNSENTGLVLKRNGDTIASLLPMVADGNTPYKLDTSVAHSSGNFLEVANSGTNLFVLGVGNLSIGDATNYFNVAFGPGGVTHAQVASDDGFTLHDNGIDINTLGDGSAEISLVSTTNFYTNSMDIAIYAKPSLGNLGIKLSDESIAAVYTLIEPTAADGNTPYKLDTSVAHTSGNLLELGNNGTNKFTVDYTGKITATGVVDPPAVLFDNESRASIEAMTEQQIPSDKGAGAVMFFNAQTKRIELLVPSDNAFYDLNGTKLANTSKNLQLHAPVPQSQPVKSEPPGRKSLKRKQK